MKEHYSIQLLCRVGGVSKSGYYKWLKSSENIKDEESALKIAEIFFKSKKKAGFRTIKMDLLREYGMVMNHKKIIRIMRKYDMRSKIRRVNPYKAMMKIRQENLSYPNLLNREFKKFNPYEA